MAINIPTLPQGTNTRVTLMSSAVELDPHLGGEKQRIARLGDRWSYEVTCRPMRVDQAGALVAALIQGLSQPVECSIKQEGFPHSDYIDSASLVTQVVSGSTQATVSQPTAPVVGQMFSINSNGNPMVYMVTSVTPNGSNYDITVQPPLKRDYTTAAFVRFANPRIYGFIEGQQQSWDIGLVKNLGVAFKINEIV